MNIEPVITFATAGEVIDAAALGLITLAVLGTVVRGLDTGIVLLSLQGVLLAVAAGAAALAEMAWRTWAAFAVAFAVKAVFIPLILWIVLQRMAVKREMETVISVKLGFPLAVLLVPVSYRAMEPFTEDAFGGFDAANALPAALALMLLGLFTMITRKKALTQVIGLVTMENGLYLATVAATRGLPFVVEFGVALDVLTGVTVMGLVIHEINRLFGSTDVDKLRALRF